jgi:hypothetical protein
MWAFGRDDVFALGSKQTQLPGGANVHRKLDEFE